jgi:hypothetical protein
LEKQRQQERRGSDTYPEQAAADHAGPECQDTEQFEIEDWFLCPARMKHVKDEKHGSAEHQCDRRFIRQQIAAQHRQSEDER